MNNVSNKTVKIIRLPDVTDLSGDKVMIDFDSGKYYMLTGAANFIWDALEDGISVDSIVDRLMREYEVDRDECLKSTADFLNRLAEAGFIELVDKSWPAQA